MLSNDNLMFSSNLKSFIVVVNCRVKHVVWRLAPIAADFIYEEKICNLSLYNKLTQKE